MNAGFHYYATYVAARFAGHSSNESITIARAAQHIDESSASLIKSELLGVNPGSTPTPTIESFERLAKKNLFTSKSELNETRTIWTSFHFLPGNFPCDGGQPYEGKRKWLARTIEPAEERDVLLVCRPNSTLATAMINDLAVHRDENYYLYLLGIRMHVLADTWVHEGFSGTCNWWINDLASTPTWVKSNEPIGFKAGTLKKLTISKPLITTPAAPSCDSYSYLGHGRMGHVPDLPYACYTYQPHWSQREFERNNPEAHMKAFRQMVEAMSVLRRGESTFACRTYWEEPSEHHGQMEEIAGIFGNRTGYDGSQGDRQWGHLVNQLREGQGELPPLDPEMWMSSASTQAESNRNKTSYYLFNKAASIHTAFVQDKIAELMGNEMS